MHTPWLDGFAPESYPSLVNPNDVESIQAEIDARVEWWLLACAIRDRRIEKNFSHEQLAEIANVSASLISRIERGIANPRLDTLIRVTKALGFKVALVPIETTASIDVKTGQL